MVLIVTGLLAGSATVRQQTAAETGARAGAARPGVTASQIPSPVEPAEPQPAVPRPLAVPAAPADEGLDLRAGPVPVPLELRLPTLGVNATILGVGITPEGAMDAPMGAATNPIWQRAFWYRGSAVPGAASTALIAGHIDDPLGQPAVFGHIAALRVGDPIVVHDTRSGLDVQFSVTQSETYRLDQTNDAAVLTQIYGAGPVAGTEPQPSADGLAHLTLITCAGTFRNGTHDHRLVVSATRTA